MKVHTSANYTNATTTHAGFFGIDNMDTPEFKAILDGTYQCPIQCNVYLQKLLPCLQCPKDLIPIPMQSYDEYKRSWKIAREKWHPHLWWCTLATIWQV